MVRKTKNKIDKIDYDSYQPKYKIGDKFIHKQWGTIFTVKQIDNKCSDLHSPDTGYVNPGHKEYYLQAQNKSWIRIYCYAVDTGDCDIVPLTKAAKLLFCTKKKKGQP